MLEWGGPNWVGYDVHGATLLDVYNVIAAMPEAGKAEWGDSNYSMEFDDKGEVTSVTANILYKVTMPTWVEVDQAPQAAQDEWGRFWSALEAHEQGHLQILDDNVSGVDERMVGKSKTAAEKEWNDTFAKIQKLSDEYDASTRNGQNDGTILDTSAGEPEEGEAAEGESEEQ